MDITSYLAIKKVKLHGKLSLPPNRKIIYKYFLLVLIVLNYVTVSAFLKI